MTLPGYGEMPQPHGVADLVQDHGVGRIYEGVHPVVTAGFEHLLGVCQGIAAPLLVMRRVDVEIGFDHLA